MAECVKQRYQPPSVVAVPPQEIEFVLRLSEDEASVLKQIINRIGGDPTGPRGTLDEIGLSLHKAGVGSSVYKTQIHRGPNGVLYLRIEKGDG